MLVFSSPVRSARLLSPTFKKVSFCHLRHPFSRHRSPVLTRHNQGKVRDIYSFPEDPAVLLIVATDRISAFDYVLGSGIPDKGRS